MFQSVELTFQGCAGAAVGTGLAVRERWRSGTRRYKDVPLKQYPMFLNGPFHQGVRSLILEIKLDSGTGLAPEPSSFNNGGR
jgi:hypothetical protein